jgi:hypothetical protein
MDRLTDLLAETDTDDISPYACTSSRKLHDAADRALDYYFNRAAPDVVADPPASIFVIAPDINNETLLAHASESLACATVMASDFAGGLEGSHRKTMLALQQIIVLGQMAVNRVLDNVGKPGSV